MDLFYNSLHPSSFSHLPARRVHFNQFMVDIHKQNHQMKLKYGDTGDSIVPIAREMARKARVLCFDEFQVTDIADAMILKRLLEALLGYGVVSVMTSNRPPSELYKNGIQRESFLPCIDLIEQHFVVKCLDSGTDYRRLPRAFSKVYFDPITPANRREMDKFFSALSGDEAVVTNRRLMVWGRPLYVPESTKHVARFTFDDLCGKPLSSADYLEITKTFETVFITDVPKLAFSQRELARRFILFIDACYESKTKLFTLSEVPITQIFSDKPTGSEAEDISHHQRNIMDDLGLDAAAVGAASMFSGEEEFFAFARAVSRLTEMGTQQWAQTPVSHAPTDGDGRNSDSAAAPSPK